MLLTLRSNLATHVHPRRRRTCDAVVVSKLSKSPSVSGHGAGILLGVGIL